MDARSYSVLATSVVFSSHARVSLRESIRHSIKLMQKPFKTRVVRGYPIFFFFWWLPKLKLLLYAGTVHIYKGQGL